MCDTDEYVESYGRITKVEKKELVVKTNRFSNAYFRLVAAGWTIREPVKSVFSGENYFVSFVCVCGKTETLNIYGLKENVAFGKYSNFYTNGWLDVAGILEMLGSTGIKHLKEDGYSKEQILEIRKVYR